MSPSSLIFVVVVAVWAAYLVIDTSRRREYLATAQSVDRFSASMRVLQRRAVRRESAEAFEASTAPMRSTSSVRLHRHATPSRAATEARAAEAAVRPLGTRRTGVTSAVAARRQAAVRLRRARALAVAALVLVLATLGCAVAAGLGLVHWAIPVTGILLGTGVVALMRREALEARRSRAAAASARASTPERRTGATRVEAEDDGFGLARTRPAAAAAPVVRDHVPFDYAREVEPIIAAEHEARAATLAAESDPLHGLPGWQPVPVPPPTYTLKARAERPLPPPLEVEQDYVPAVEEWAEEDVYYRASGQ